MKKILVAASLAAFLAPGLAFACTQEEATNKLMKLMEKMEPVMSAADTAEETQKLVAVNEKINQAGTALAEGKYDDACKLYDEAAADAGVDLSQ